MLGHHDLWLCLQLEACLDRTIQGYRTFFVIFSSKMETPKEPYRNLLIKDVKCQCGVIGIGNYCCHERGESGAYVSVPCVLKLAENHLDHGENGVYWAERTCSVWPLKSWSRTLHKSVSSFKTRHTHMLINVPYSFSHHVFVGEKVLQICTNT